MLLRIPYQFEVLGRKRGNRTSGQYEFFETVECDIPELSGDDAPVAVEWPDDFDSAASSRVFSVGEISRRSDTQRRHTRFHGGDHWFGMLESDNIYHAPEGMYPPLTADRFKAGLLAPTSNRLVPLHRGYRHGKYHLLDDAHEHFDEIRMSGRTVAREEAVRRAGELLIIDGDIHRKSPAPFICLSKVDALGTAFYVVKVSVDSDDERLHLSNENRKFDILDFDRALSEADRLNAWCSTERGYEYWNGYNPGRRPEVLLPQSLDPDRIVVMEVVDRMRAIQNRTAAAAQGMRSTQAFGEVCMLGELWHDVGGDLDAVDRALASILSYPRRDLDDLLRLHVEEMRAAIANRTVGLDLSMEMELPTP
jgi:hypothetical protein